MELDRAMAVNDGGGDGRRRRHSSRRRRRLGGVAGCCPPPARERHALAFTRTTHTRKYERTLIQHSCVESNPPPPL